MFPLRSPHTLVGNKIWKDDSYVQRDESIPVTIFIIKDCRCSVDRQVSERIDGTNSLEEWFFTSTIGTPDGPLADIAEWMDNDEKQHYGIEDYWDCSIIDVDFSGSNKAMLTTLCNILENENDLGEE